MGITKQFNIFFWGSLILLGCLYIVGMQLSLMDVDATEYALISKEMFNSGHYLQITERGGNYLDKPPLLFWLACVSFKIFGVHDWAFRLPSVLCLVLGIYSAYRFTKMHYDELSARLAALIMAATCASQLMTHDVRTDTMLTGWVMFSLWQLAEFNRLLKFKNILLGAIGVGLAMITKGPIGIIIPVTAFSCEFIYKREWKSFFRWQYLVAVVVIGIILTPMCYGLYEQYDSQAGNPANHGLHTSGLRFYFWTQSFGRITGENVWNNNPDPFFLVHSFAWSFLPWTGLFLIALYTGLKDKIKSIRKPGDGEVIIMSGFLFVFIFLTRSKYQLPHYTFPLHPLAAIILGVYLGKKLVQPDKVFGFFAGLQVFVISCLFIGQFLLLFFVFSPDTPIPIVVTIMLLVFMLFTLFEKRITWPYRVVLSTVITFISVVFVLNTHFYPNLLDYQVWSAAPKDINEMADKDATFLIYNNYARNSTMFYSKLPIIEFINDNTLPLHLVKGKTYILADTVDTKRILEMHNDIKEVKTYGDFGVTGLSGQFLNPKTRNSVVGKLVLLKY